MTISIFIAINIKQVITFSKSAVNKNDAMTFKNVISTFILSVIASSPITGFEKV